jgi:hypothetical protein
MRRRLRRQVQRPLALVGACAMLAAAACTFDQQAVAVQPPQVVVHAVLDPGATEQQVLVERTLSGTVDIPKNQRFDPEDPINSGGGIPIADCEVTVTGPDGVFRGVEAPAPFRPSSYSTGRYILTTGTIVQGPRVILRPGARYELRIRTPDGTVVTGSTVIPQAAAFVPGSRLDAFNRDRDSLRLTWRDVAAARSDLLRIESPFGPFLLFSDSTHLALPGNLRNYVASSLERVFIPGFRQRVNLSAVDSNFFDYYRSRNDPFTGSGIINRLEGGIGLFGAAVSLNTRTLDVTQTLREPTFEGTYDVTSPPTLPRAVADVIRLYVETPGDPSALSGWFTRNRASGVLEGMLGTRTGGRVVLEFLENQSSIDTVAVFSGELRGDSLVGGYVGVPGNVVFVRRRLTGSTVSGTIVRRTPTQSAGLAR